MKSKNKPTPTVAERRHIERLAAQACVVFGNNLGSTMSNDQAIESEIQAKGKTAARVTPADIEANIASEHFFTATDGRDGAILLTFCVLVLKNGFTVTGESDCASPENFDAEIGEKIARGKATQKIWALMGYELRSKLAARHEKTL